MTSAPPIIVHGFMLGRTPGAVDELLRQHACAVIGEGRTTDVVALASRLTPAQAAALEDPQAITALALMHAARLGEVAATMDIVPLKFGTFASSLTAMSGICDQAEPQVRAALERIAGRLEFGVRIAQIATADTVRDVKPTNGRDYLRSRVDKRAQDRRASEARQTFAAAVREVLGQVCVAQQPLSDDRASSALLLNLACLVERRGVGAFLQVAQSYACDASSLGLTLTVTGAWPAYSFVADRKVHGEE
ncbi:putative gas vesicle synthesis protein, GvpF/L-like [Bradyrhizobium sp. ORS 278]|uniref:GvpL/GvpF family gas vesicle protein n=1 Tax=Bradyrhizobium sp. (strain ORS 278) TaxID=114615 RepID=UPI0001507D2A|nr:GvpL/GvpF family gas vesicle protein [Bradyrhizobium sp. ORS 278]CAL75178.1 putative gas vesicle synthesis protein, GvpF/L-like [Bradyrhizobium sp. ORS 278]